MLGYLIYRGGVKINLSKFFRITGVVLVLVGAGLFSFAVHTAHEAGWWNILLDRAVDLTLADRPGLGAVGADHRHVRDPARAHVGRGCSRSLALRDPDDASTSAGRSRVPRRAREPTPAAVAATVETV